jgi:hypothetical protein
MLSIRDHCLCGLTCPTKHLRLRARVASSGALGVHVGEDEIQELPKGGVFRHALSPSSNHGAGRA